MDSLLELEPRTGGASAEGLEALGRWGTGSWGEG